MESDWSEKLMSKWEGGQESGFTRKRAMRALMSEYLALLKDPEQGFTVTVEDPFNWDVGVYGPPATPYWGGYFKLVVSFPFEYPFEPPKLRFKERFWHPNVYPNGAVCMSILHEASEESLSGLAVDEKWNPTLSVRTILLSLISLISTPNPDSPANVDATKMYRAWSEGRDESFVRVVSELVAESQGVAEREGVRIPRSLEEYCGRSRVDKSECLQVSSDEDDSSCSLASSPFSSLSSSPCSTPEPGQSTHSLTQSNKRSRHPHPNQDKKRKIQSDSD